MPSPRSSQVATSIPGSARAEKPRSQCDAAHAHDLLEALDDAIFGALAGDGDALARAPGLWRQAAAALDPALVDESREHYIQFAIDALRQSAADGTRNSAAAVAALEIVELLASDC
jgi:hypothetical protein